MGRVKAYSILLRLFFGRRRLGHATLGRDRQQAPKGLHVPVLRSDPQLPLKVTRRRLRRAHRLLLRHLDGEALLSAHLRSLYMKIYIYMYIYIIPERRERTAALVLKQRIPVTNGS